jgi:hypothetical protein
VATKTSTVQTDGREMDVATMFATVNKSLDRIVELLEDVSDGIANPVDMLANGMAEGES